MIPDSVCQVNPRRLLLHAERRRRSRSVPTKEAPGVAAHRQQSHTGGGWPSVPGLQAVQEGEDGNEGNEMLANKRSLRSFNTCQSVFLSDFATAYSV